jgi:quinol monooxygenase YgiN
LIERLRKVEMSEPIVFISHFRIRAGKADALKGLATEITEGLHGAKPQTLVYLAYADEERGVITFIHVFGDADAMDIHFEGADERSRVAYEFMEPAGWEIFGRPSADAIEMMHQAAESVGVTLTVESDYVAGFLRASSG